jgi:hypothetical protein
MVSIFLYLFQLKRFSFSSADFVGNNSRNDNFIRTRSSSGGIKKLQHLVEFPEFLDLSAYQHKPRGETVPDAAASAPLPASSPAFAPCSSIGSPGSKSVFTPLKPSSFDPCGNLSALLPSGSGILSEPLNSRVPLSETLYRLASVVVHSGLTPDSGHYTAYVRSTAATATAATSTGSGGSGGGSSPASQWYLVNDQIVKPVSIQEVMLQPAYLLFYEKVSRLVESFSTAAAVAGTPGIPISPVNGREGSPFVGYGSGKAAGFTSRDGYNPLFRAPRAAAAATSSVPGLMTKDAEAECDAGLTTSPKCSNAAKSKDRDAAATVPGNPGNGGFKVARKRLFNSLSFFSGEQQSLKRRRHYQLQLSSLKCGKNAGNLNQSNQRSLGSYPVQACSPSPSAKAAQNNALMCSSEYPVRTKYSDSQCENVLSGANFPAGAADSSIDIHVQNSQKQSHQKPKWSFSAVLRSLFSSN